MSRCYRYRTAASGHLLLTLRAEGGVGISVGVKLPCTYSNDYFIKVTECDEVRKSQNLLLSGCKVPLW